MTATLHADDYRFTLDTEAIPDDDRELLKLLIESQRDLAQYMLDIANEQFKPNELMTPPTSRFEHGLTYADYDGDHTDYNPAAAACLATVTYCITSDIFWSMTMKDDVAAALGLTKDADGYWPYTARTRLGMILSTEDFLLDLETCSVSWLATISECNYDDEED